VVAGLIWRTFGPRPPSRAHSVLDWAGLLEFPAGRVTDLAGRHQVTASTIRARVRHTTIRGTFLCLTPVVISNAARCSTADEDHLSRQRCAQLLGLPPPLPGIGR
jgi:hypothetical protein